MFKALGFYLGRGRSNLALMEAFKYGTPPPAGYGLDKLLPCGWKATIRDVIAFPKVQNAWIL